MDYNCFHIFIFPTIYLFKVMKESRNCKNKHKTRWLTSFVFSLDLNLARRSLVVTSVLGSRTALISSSVTGPVAGDLLVNILWKWDKFLAEEPRIRIHVQNLENSCSETGNESLVKTYAKLSLRTTYFVAPLVFWIFDILFIIPENASFSCTHTNLARINIFKQMLKIIGWS